METLSVRSCISKKAIHLAALFLLLAANRSIGAAWQGCDDFSSGISAANWTVYNNYKGQMTVVGTNGHASFIVPTNATTEQNAFIVWRGTPTAAEDWMVEITGHDSANAQLQFAVLDWASWNTGQVYGFRVSMDNDGTPPSGSVFNTAWWFPSGAGYIDRASVSTTSSNLFGLCLVYHAASQTIEAWYEPIASGLGWAKLDSMTLSAFSPAMTVTNTFGFLILADSDNTLEPNGPISEGQIWADNFCAMSTPPLLLLTAAQRSAGSQVLHLTWTNNSSMCLLESAGALTGGWSTVSTPWITNAGWVSTTVTNASRAQFYRLQAN